MRNRPGKEYGVVVLSERIYRALLILYPRHFRHDFGDEMARSFRNLCEEELRRGGRTGLFKLWLYTLLELPTTAVKERGHSFMDVARLTRLGGSIAAVGGILLVVYGAAIPLYGRLFISTGAGSQALFSGLQLVAGLGPLLMVGGLLGLSCQITMTGSFRRAGFAARVVALAGLALAAVAGLGWTAGLLLMLINGAPEVSANSVADVLIPILATVGMWSLSVSTGLLGFVVWWTGVLGRWSALPLAVGLATLSLLILATVSTLVSGPRTLLPRETLETFIYIGAPIMVVGLGWVLLGYALRSAGAAGSRSSVPVRS